MQDALQFQDRFIHGPRLKDFSYVGAIAYHIVTVTRDREPLLTGAMASAACAELERAADATSFDALTYIIMPDHVHALVNGTT